MHQNQQLTHQEASLQFASMKSHLRPYVNLVDIQVKLDLQ